MLRRIGALRVVTAWSLAWGFAAALYLLLIDITDLPELLVGAGAATLAATGFELAREQHIATEAIRLRWLLRMHRPVMKVATDMALVLATAAAQLVRPRRARGEFRTVRFRSGDDAEALEMGRRALAEALGSFAPNTIVIGVDRERGAILAHQLRRTGGDDAIDLLRLG